MLLSLNYLIQTEMQKSGSSAGKLLALYVGADAGAGSDTQSHTKVLSSAGVLVHTIFLRRYSWKVTKDKKFKASLGNINILLTYKQINSPS